MRDILHLDPLNGSDIHKVWPSLRPGPISPDPADYAAPARLRFATDPDEFIPDPAGTRRVRRKTLPPWVRKRFPVRPSSSGTVAMFNRSVIEFLCLAVDPERPRTIRPECRRRAIALLRMLELDPLDGADIHKVWPGLLNLPISDDPDDYQDDFLDGYAFERHES